MVSVVIPTLNAAASLPRALAPLARPAFEGLVKQVIVSDGGSDDDSIAIAEAAGCAIVQGPRGRAKQMRAGAALARGRWLLFLHADTALDGGWAAEAHAFMSERNAQHRAAAFQLAFDDESAAAKRVAFLANLRARWLKLPYGDQGLLISRFLYDAVGGFPELPLMEDVAMVRNIGARRLRILATRAVTSAEKYRRDGFDKRAWRNLGLLSRYLLGGDPVELARRYD
ncbi:MAG: TIGR04283 family arsenosugar biosynthesis glycosyltransferase [Hyphomonadaceae bacterium]|nr:TIGR04283 family arsenosugar biosynthesis glycosyltransferase [Hyphomonadaceae bacterium]